MEILQSYPIAFLVSVALPLLTGVVLSVGGYETLRSRLDSDKQLQRIESQTSKTLSEVAGVSETFNILNRYEKTLSAYNQHDEVLAAVMAQYQKIAEFSHNEADPATTKNNVAIEYLDLLTSSLIPVSEQQHRNQNSLILNLGNNKFRVLFGAPMIQTPDIGFFDIPPGVTPTLIQSSNIGFTVVFEPRSVNIEKFDFTADAEIY